MIKFFVLSFFVTGYAFASGCDSSYFQSFGDHQEILIKDFGILSTAKTKQVVDEMRIKHEVSLFPFKVPPVISGDMHVQLISTTYFALDTDCGWSHFGSRLTIQHLKLSTLNEVIYYPDIFRDIDAEYRGTDSFITIE